MVYRDELHSAATLLAKSRELEYLIEIETLRYCLDDLDRVSDPFPAEVQARDNIAAAVERLEQERRRLVERRRR